MKKDFFDVAGRVALVTGARRGLGLAIATGLAEAGARVAGVSASADHEDLSAAAAKAGAELLYIPVDLAERDQRRRVVAAVVRHFGRLDILVNCAGIQHRQASMEFDLAAWDRIISLMMTGVFELCQQAARVMGDQGGGKIINIASVAAFQGGWTIPAYAAAKHGVAGITKALANEWASKNIHVNAVAPGYFETDMCEALMNDPVREPKIREHIPVLLVDGGWMGR